MGESIKIVVRASVSTEKKLEFTRAEREKLTNLLRMMKSGEVRLTIESWSERKEQELIRSQAQNRYYHKLLDIIADYTGDTHIELHDIFKAKFLGRPYVHEDKEYIVVPSTTSLNSKNFGEYLEKIFAFVGENYELILPSPEDYY